MRVTIVRDDNTVGVDGVSRTIDLSRMMPEGVSVIQWSGENGHMEYYSDEEANLEFDTITKIQSFVDLWIAAAPIPKPVIIGPYEMITAAQVRIDAAYIGAVEYITGKYPAQEKVSWPRQESEARAWLIDNSTPTPFIDAAAAAREKPKPELIAGIIRKADALAPLHGALTGKRKALMDQIAALGPVPAQEQLNLIQW